MSRFRHNRAVLIGMVLAILALASPASATPGDLDTTFSRDGKATVAVGGSDQGEAVRVDSKGRTVVAATVVPVGGNESHSRFGLLRLTRRGRVDNSFSSDGRLMTNAGSHGKVTSMFLQGDNRIVVLGTGNGRLVVVRYQEDGRIDRSFSRDGFARPFFGEGHWRSRAMVARRSGTVIVMGQGQGGVGLARLTPEGRLDRSFGRDGKIVHQSLGMLVESLLLMPDGHMMIVGWAGIPDSRDQAFVLARLKGNGLIDRTFGDGGVIFQDRIRGGQATAAALQPDGKVVVAGYGQVLARFHPDGSVDTSFGDGGAAQTVPNSEVTGLAVQPNGRIVAVGVRWEEVGTPGFASVARYTPRGLPDQSFGSRGRVDLKFGEVGAVLEDVVLTSEKITAVGWLDGAQPGVPVTRLLS